MTKVRLIANVALGFIVAVHFSFQVFLEAAVYHGMENDNNM